MRKICSLSFDLDRGPGRELYHLLSHDVDGNGGSRVPCTENARHEVSLHVLICFDFRSFHRSFEHVKDVHCFLGSAEDYNLIGTYLHYCWSEKKREGTLRGELDFLPFSE